MSTVDERYAEKIRARAEGRAPVVTVTAPVDLPEGASVHERYLAKLAARAAGAQGAQQKPAEAKAPAAEEPKPAPKSDATAPAEAKAPAKK